jgi:SIR2-like domain
MTKGFDYKTLSAVYDRGCLVPFIGSGMSIPICATWAQFVERLEKQTGIDDSQFKSRSLIQRALFALQRLAREGGDLGATVRAAVYVDKAPETPTHSEALASVFWPLICSTNYDDVYLRASMKARGVVPRIVGRSEGDCRQVLKHLSLPDGEMLWVLQGFLTPMSAQVKAAIGVEFDAHRLEQELVVGHAEYRRAAHRVPHFRRCFAELFRTRSLLFLGSGLEEPYFRALFDEVIELSGPPVRPHFALVEEDKVDPGFMREQYHIVCHTYPKGHHATVSQVLAGFSDFIRGPRTRPSGWSFRLNSSARVSTDDCTGGHFEVNRASLPNPRDLMDGQVVAASCGRGEDNNAAASPSTRGVPLLGEQAVSLVGVGSHTPDWINDWVVKWQNTERCYGIVARELTGVGGSPRDRRSPEAIRKAFRAFLDVVEAERVEVAHVQLLSAGRHRVFQPWVSLVQMARAYGQWARESSREGGVPRVRVVVYVVDPGVIALLTGGHIDLVEQLEDTHLRISVEIFDARGQAEVHHLIVDPAARIGSLSLFSVPGRMPKLYAHPVPTRKFEPMELGQARPISFRDFGLVSGSTLVVDYRA